MTNHDYDLRNFGGTSRLCFCCSLFVFVVVVFVQSCCLAVFLKFAFCFQLKSARFVFVKQETE